MPIDLTQFDSDFAEAKVVSDDVKSGKYNAKIHKVEIGSAKSGAPMLKWTLKIQGGEYEGRLLFRNNQFGSKEQLAWLKKDLGTAGVKIERVSDLPKHLEAMLDRVLAVTVKTREGHEGQPNVYFDKLVSGPLDVGPMPPKDNNDPIPF